LNSLGEEIRGGEGFAVAHRGMKSNRQLVDAFKYKVIELFDPFLYSQRS